MIQGVNMNLKGIPAWKFGIIKGKILISDSPRDLKYVNEKVIIVCESLTMNYIDHLDKIKGIITTTGGLLMHTAILSRELKIPCVVNVSDANSLKSGIIVEMNDDGTIKVMR